MSTARTKKERFLPYRYDKLGLDLRVERVEIDGLPGEGPIDHDRKFVDLEGAWNTALLHVAVSVPSSLVGRVVPDDEVQAAALTVVLAVTCDDTRYRRGATLIAAPADSDGTRHFRGTIHLERDDLAGHVELTPWLIRREPSAQRVSGFAAHAGARVAGGRSWEARIDRRRAPEGKYLEVRFKSFRRDEGIAERDHANVWKLEYDQPSPVLWLNEDHPTLQQTLSSEAPTGVAARVREVAFDLVAFPVWSRLLIRACKHRFGDGEFTYDWEEGVLETLAGWLYPEKSTRTAQLEVLEYEWEDIDRVLNRLDAALQREHEFASHLTKLIEEAR